MPRRMSFESRARIDALVEANPKAVGPRLGRVSLKYNIPARAFASLLQISEPTVYRWFYGESTPRAVYMTNIKRLFAVFKLAAAAEDVPLEGTYAQRMKAVRDLIIKHKPNVHI